MRLIDADRLETILSETVMIIIRNPKMDNQEAHVRAAFDTFGKMIHNAPIIDAVPVKHGKWIWMGEQGDSRHMCSVCKAKEKVPTIMGEPIVWEYCPNCGAKMDGGKDNV